jgi:hypothetical protein
LSSERGYIALPRLRHLPFKIAAQRARPPVSEPSGEFRPPIIGESTEMIVQFLCRGAVRATGLAPDVGAALSFDQSNL